RWERSKWEIEDRDASDAKTAAIDGGVATNIDGHSVRVKGPLGFWQLAGSDGSVGNDEVIGAGFFNDLSCKCEGTGRRQDGPAAFHLNTDCANDVVELPAVAADVVGTVAGLDVFIVRPPVEDHVPFAGGLAGIGVERHFVRI